jgi:hypothetical protein
MRYRQVSLILGSLAALALTFFSDPDVGPKMGFSVKVRTKMGKEVTATESIKLARGEAVHTPESTDSD